MAETALHTPEFHTPFLPRSPQEHPEREALRRSLLDVERMQKELVKAAEAARLEFGPPQRHSENGRTADARSRTHTPPIREKVSQSSPVRDGESGCSPEEPTMRNLVRSIAQLHRRLQAVEKQMVNDSRRRQIASSPAMDEHFGTPERRLPTALQVANADIGRGSWASRSASTDETPETRQKDRSSPVPRPSKLSSLDYKRQRLSVTTLSEEMTSSVAMIKAETQELSLLDYLHVEVLGAHAHGPQPEPERLHETMANFFAVPWRLEQLLVFGFFICLDTFLYVIAYLPLRVLAATTLLIMHPFHSHRMRKLRETHEKLEPVVRRRLSGNRERSRSPPSPIVASFMQGFHRTHMYDLLQMLLICVGTYALRALQLGRVYHFIRGQAMIKLYVLIAMVEIFDKLLSSFGQDAMDALYWQARKSPRSFQSMIWTLFVATIYTILHSCLLFIHVATLNVAINSVDAALLTVLISSNFAEIKSFVFKKFDKKNVFQLGCHDVVERFKLWLFMSLIGLLSWCNGNLELGSFFQLTCVVFSAEMLADWVKHGFIAKFNSIDASAFGEYAVVLANDITTCRRQDMPRVINDHTYAISKRLGFAQLPLTCLLIRFLMMAYPHIREAVKARSNGMFFCICALAFLCCVLLKILTGLLLMATSKAITTAEKELMTGLSPRRRSMSDLERKEELTAYDKVDRFTPVNGRVV